MSLGTTPLWGQGIELGIITTEWNDEASGSTCVVCLEKPCEIVFAQCGNAPAALWAHQLRIESSFF